MLVKSDVSQLKKIEKFTRVRIRPDGIDYQLLRTFSDGRIVLASHTRDEIYIHRYDYLYVPVTPRKTLGQLKPGQFFRSNNNTMCLMKTDTYGDLPYNREQIRCVDRNGICYVIKPEQEGRLVYTFDEPVIN